MKTASDAIISLFLQQEFNDYVRSQSKKKLVELDTTFPQVLKVFHISNSNTLYAFNKNFDVFAYIGFSRHKMSKTISIGDCLYIDNAQILGQVFLSESFSENKLSTFLNSVTRKKIQAHLLGSTEKPITVKHVGSIYKKDLT